MDRNTSPLHFALCVLHPWYKCINMLCLTMLRSEHTCSIMWCNEEHLVWLLTVNDVNLQVLVYYFESSNVQFVGNGLKLQRSVACPSVMCVLLRSSRDIAMLLHDVNVCRLTFVQWHCVCWEKWFVVSRSHFTRTLNWPFWSCWRPTRTLSER